VCTYLHGDSMQQGGHLGVIGVVGGEHPHQAQGLHQRQQDLAHGVERLPPVGGGVRDESQVPLQRPQEFDVVLGLLGCLQAKLRWRIPKVG